MYATPMSGRVHLARSPVVKAAVQLAPLRKWTRAVQLCQRQLPVIAAVPGARPDNSSLRARLNSLRRSSTDVPPPLEPTSQPDGGSLEQLRSSGENLRMLLERRARRQQRSAEQLHIGSGDSPRISAPPSNSLVPSGPADVAASRTGGNEVESAGAGLRRVSRIRFWLKYRAEWGQRLKVVGTHENLGNWMLNTAPELKWSDGDMWHVTVELPAGTIVEYKYVLLDHSGQHAIAWQRGNNSVLAVRHSDEFVEVFDNWGGDPGAKVVSDGGPPTTREGRLLSWAGEVDAQLTSQRAELRRARMELVAAQEDAKLARQDAMRYRAQLAQLDGDKLVALARARELEVTNRLLHAQLEDVTRSFRQALETAAELLQHTDDVIDAAVAAVGGTVEGVEASHPLHTDHSNTAPAPASGKEGGEDKQQLEGAIAAATPKPAPPPQPVVNSATSSMGGGSTTSRSSLNPPAGQSISAGIGNSTQSVQSMAGGSIGGDSSSSSGASMDAVPVKRKRGRPRKVLPPPESGAAAATTPLGKLQRGQQEPKPKSLGGSRPTAAVPVDAAPVAALQAPVAPSRPSLHLNTGVDRGLRDVGLSTSSRSRSPPPLRQAVRMSAMPGVGNFLGAAGIAPGGSGIPPYPVGWRSGQRLKLARDLARGQEPGALREPEAAKQQGEGEEGACMPQ